MNSNIGTIGTIGNVQQNNTNLDNHIKVKLVKEKKATRTYIIGLDLFVHEKEKREDFRRDLQKSFGTSGITKIVDDVENIGINGDHVAKLKSLINAKFGIPLDRIRNA